MKKYLLIGLALAAFTFTSCSKDDEIKSTPKPKPVVGAVVVSEITVSGADITDFKGTTQMSVNVLPANAVDKSVEWSVDDASVATIDAAGLLTALKSGAVTVTAKAKDASGVTGTKKIVISGQKAPFTNTVWKLSKLNGVDASTCEKNTSLVFTETPTAKSFTKITHSSASGVCSPDNGMTINYTENPDGSISFNGSMTATFTITGSTLSISMVSPYTGNMETDIYIAE